MNLSSITLSPHVQGIIHVESTVDAEGSVQTQESFEILDRAHDHAKSLLDRPTLERHALHAKVAALSGNENGIREIPIRMFFNKTDSAISIGYRAYATDTGAPLCSGDGKTAKRLKTAADHTATLESHACPGCDVCAYADQPDVSCYRQVRMTVQVEGQDDDLSVFEIRSTSINSYRALHAQLQLIERRLKGLRHVPLVLKLWKSSNALSNYQAFHCMRLEYRAASEVDAFLIAEKARRDISETGMADETDEVFKVDPVDLSFFDGDDGYALAHRLGERSGRRSGTVSIVSGLAPRSAQTPKVEGADPVVIRSAAELIALAVASTPQTVGVE